MVRTFLVTANAGSLFENLEQEVTIWLGELCLAVRSKDPEFVAIHFQETGGKSSDVSESIEVFFRQLIDRMGTLRFRVAEAFVDSKSDAEDQFTALSSIYFVHESLRLPVHIWDFQDAKFHEISTYSSSSTTSSPYDNLHIGPFLDQTHRKQKEKFPQHFYPNCKWSRKGFLRTRWRFGKTVVDFVNIHLFHDSCNLTAASTFPSPFAQHREKTLKYTLDRIQSDSLEKCPLFIFGDFNFRINTCRIMEILKKDYGDPGTEPDSPLVFGTKRFNCPDKELRFKHSFEWLKQHDFESKKLSNLLHEHEVNFHPTYPFEEDVNEPEKFLKTRIPAWCDRVLFTPSTKDLFAQDFPIDYNLIGSKVCMGDHKPVYLFFKIQPSEHTTNSLNSNQDTTTPLRENAIRGNENREVELAKPASLLIPPIPPSLSTCTDATSAETTFDIPILDRGSAKTIPFFYNTIDNPSSSEAHTSCTNSTTNGSGSDSPTECKCFFALFKRGRLRFSSKGGGGASSSGNRNRAFGLALPSRSLKFKKRGGSGSLLEPITTAACDPPCSSLPSSGAPSQRPSFAFPKESTPPNDGNDDGKSIMSSNDLPFFTAPPPSPSNTRWNTFDKEFCWKCGCATKPGQVQVPEIMSTASNQGNCPNHCNRLMMNLTQNYRQVVEANGNNSVDAGTISSNGKHKEVAKPPRKVDGIEMPLVGNLGLVAINVNVSDKPSVDISDVGKINECVGANGKIPVCWTTYNNSNCDNCLINAKNLQNHHHSRNHSNGLPFKFRARSASQGSAAVNPTKCKCKYKAGMTKTGGCVSCSKCVIL
ncbi:unnamed protein product [Orchesella dallaii]|uniref:inositol-polyphosphate 5-phosphatase n=1 Tax=Orchesella dallaii TaxID=48710 RepID=A0ABP1Q892_9HEXA